MKNWTPLLLIPALFALSARAQENRYELLGKTLQPVAAIFSVEDNGQPRALSAQLTLGEMTGVPSALIGGKLRVAIQYPDKCRIDGLLLNGGTGGTASATICRDGQEVWVHPGSLAKMLIAQAGELPKKKQKKTRLDDFRLPFPEKQLVFLPILFEVADAGTQAVAGQSCRLLDLRLMPELARAVYAEDWAARAAIYPDHKFAWLTLARSGWHMAASVDRMDFSAALPPETWQPSAAEAGDLLKLNAVETAQILQALNRQFRGKVEKALERPLAD